MHNPSLCRMRASKAVQAPGSLGPRLERILHFIPPYVATSHSTPVAVESRNRDLGGSGWVVADVGADHGHLAARLAARQDVRHVYATGTWKHGCILVNF